MHVLKLVFKNQNIPNPDISYRVKNDEAPVSVVVAFGTFLQKYCGKHKEAGVQFQKATTLAPHAGDILGSFAAFLSKNGDIDRADLYFRRDLDVDPNNTNLLGNFASFCHRFRNDIDLAIDIIKKSLESEPTHCNNLCKYAKFLKLKGPKHYDAAEQQYLLACGLPDATATVLCNFATFLYVETLNIFQARFFLTMLPLFSLCLYSTWSVHHSSRKKIRKNYVLAKEYYIKVYSSKKKSFPHPNYLTLYR